MNFVTKCMIGFILSIIMTSTMPIEAHATTIDQRNYELAEKKVKTVISQIITSDMNDTDKVVAIHDWICENSSYRSDKDTDSTACGPLLTGYGCCAGYADTFHMFMNALDIKDRRVKGIDDHNNGYHRWNEVYVDGNWYGVDTTWDDNVDSISRDYCLITPEQMAENHTFIRYYDKQEFSDDEIEKISKQIVTPSMDDIDKVIAVHDWICKNMRYVEYSDCSTDYSELFSRFMRLYSIESRRACGYTDKGTWQWNEVRINGKWLTVDCAFDDLTDSIGDTGRVRSRDYCLISASKAADDHTVQKYLDTWI